MKAAFISQYGDAAVLTVSEQPKPVIQPGQVLIRVMASGVNPVDFHIRNGMLSGTETHTLPLILGWDCAGIIDEVADKVDHLKPGDEVYAYTPIQAQGTNAQWIAVDADVVRPKPTNLSFVQAAALPLAALTAWQGLFSQGKLQSGQRLLVHNASGAVGSLAVQLAKAKGATVIATGSASKQDYIKALGADEVRDYHQADWHKGIEPVDMVYAARGGLDLLQQSVDLIKPGGFLISTLDELPEAQLAAKRVHFHRMWVNPNGGDLEQITTLVESGQLQMAIDSVYPLEQIQAAHQRCESHQALGKIVLDLSL
ncbi:NADP-dependent oxidoreductase [Bowmanella denitrificans]|uniref:NADP-dependent oxidoreductase n=1 Tax=Bowmanella denitrificans TaxID=366582 RepID=A0ABN0X4M4_9ALTE